MKMRNGFSYNTISFLAIELLAKILCYKHASTHSHCFRKAMNEMFLLLSEWNNLQGAVS